MTGCALNCAFSLISVWPAKMFLLHLICASTIKKRLTTICVNLFQVGRYIFALGTTTAFVTYSEAQMYKSNVLRQSFFYRT